MLRRAGTHLPDLWARQALPTFGRIIKLLTGMRTEGLLLKIA
jgi:hypothetical protein